ncbi:RNA polymerase sigma factor SigZ [Thalassotalea euphylliae]|uniref:RNA polymerase sigma factor SigZ n=1 Tax=Thalassotalea euphylliae TaxID=1655234 RepID=UPI003642CD19
MSIEQIWADYKTNLQAFLHAKISNHGDVEELLQDILLKTHLNLPHLQDKENVKAWLFKIANNAVIDFYRKTGKVEAIELVDVIDEPEYSIQSDLIKCIDPFLSAMPTDEADLIRKIDLEGESQKSAAAKLGISYSTYKSRLQKSRAELKLLFDLCCDFKTDKFGNLIEYQRKPTNKNNC